MALNDDNALSVDATLNIEDVEKNIEKLAADFKEYSDAVIKELERVGTEEALVLSLVASQRTKKGPLSLRARFPLFSFTRTRFFPALQNNRQLQRGFPAAASRPSAPPGGGSSLRTSPGVPPMVMDAARSQRTGARRTRR